MTAFPRLALIQIFPIKSLDGARVSSANVLSAGALEFDRRYAILDSAGHMLNGKRAPALHRIRTEYDLPESSVTLSTDLRSIAPQTFDLDTSSHIASWLSAALDQEVSLVENRSHGFPDDAEAAGPTLISHATLAALVDWFPGTSLDEMRARLRANLEIDGVTAFWEDQLVPDPFRLGTTRWRAACICQRCVVPTRHPKTSVVTSDFVQTFTRLRDENLPATSPVPEFDHYYRVAINTIPDSHQQPGLLQVGDELHCGSD